MGDHLGGWCGSYQSCLPRLLQNLTSATFHVVFTSVVFYMSVLLCIGNRMNARAFRDIWVGVMFLKVSKLHEPEASAI